VRIGSVDLSNETVAAIGAIIAVFVVGIVRRRPVVGFAVGLGTGLVVYQTPPLIAAFVAVGACVAVWLSKPASPAVVTLADASVMVRPPERVAIGTRIAASPVVLAAFVGGIVANIGCTWLGIYPPVPRPVRIEAWLAGWPWIGGSFLAGVIGAAQLARAQTVPAQAIAAFALGWGLGNILAALLWFLGSAVLLCDAGPACL
jgi:hypothetical protein